VVWFCQWSELYLIMTTIKLDHQSTPIDDFAPTGRVIVYPKSDNNVYLINDVPGETRLITNPDTSIGEVATITGMNTSTLYELDVSVTNTFDVLLNGGNPTISFVNVPSSGATSITVRLWQDTAGSHTVSWANTIAWAGGVAYSGTLTADKVDALHFITDNSGTSWFGFIGGQNYTMATKPTLPSVPSIGFEIDAVDFSGSGQYMRRVGDFVGSATGKTGIFSCWLRVDGGNGSFRRIFCSGITLGNTSTHVQFEMTTSNTLSVVMRNSATTNIFRHDTVGTFAAGANWIHMLASWDLLNGFGHLYINDVSDVDGGLITNTNDTINYVQGDWAIASAASGAFYFNGAIAELYFAPNQYLDFSVEANRRKFRTSTGKPVDLGLDGSVPTGSQPQAYFSLVDGGTSSAFATNYGYGGNLTVTGSPTVADSSPSD